MSTLQVAEVAETDAEYAVQDSVHGPNPHNVGDVVMEH